MENINVALLIEPGTPFEFLNQSDIYVKGMQKLMEPIKDDIIKYGGWVTIEQKKDGTFGVQPHCDHLVTLYKMDEIINNFLRQQP